MTHAGYVRHQDLNDEGVVLRDEDGVTLAIQRSLEPEEQDRAAGMDTYCLVVDDGVTHYGGVVEWSRDAPDLVVLVLSAEAADALVCPGSSTWSSTPPSWTTSIPWCSGCSPRGRPGGHRDEPTHRPPRPVRGGGRLDGLHRPAPTSPRPCSGGSGADGPGRPGPDRPG